MRPFRSLALALLAAPVALGAQQRPATPPAAQQDTSALRNEQREDPRRAPNRPNGDGDGPFTRLIVRGAMLIDGTGAPARGPVDIVIEGNRITQISNVGTPGVPLDSTVRRPGRAAREIDASGMYVIPGLIDLHVHQGTQQ